MAIGKINAAAALFVTTLEIKKVAKYTAANNPDAPVPKNNKKIASIHTNAREDDGKFYNKQKLTTCTDGCSNSNKKVCNPLDFFFSSEAEGIANFLVTVGTSVGTGCKFLFIIELSIIFSCICMY
jgi:hypothetical protein